MKKHGLLIHTTSYKCQRYYTKQKGRQKERVSVCVCVCVCMCVCVCVCVCVCNYMIAIR
jgi:hypothetical protein